MSNLSEYDPIWNALKATGQVSVTANRLLHPRIVKAVVKRKWLDIGFKLQIEPRTAILYHSREHSVLTFHLEFFPKPPPKQITVEDI
jgi:hypothetical protein